MPQEIKVAQEPQQQPQVADDKAKPVSVRDSLRSAIKEQAGKDTNIEASEKKEDKEPKIKKVQKEKNEDILKVFKDDPDEVKLADDNDEPDAGDDDTNLEVSVKPEVTEKKVTVPTGLPKEVSENWEKIPSEVQTYLTKANKDLSDNKAELGRLTTRYRDVDAVVSQYEPAMRQYGVTPAQTIQRAMGWMDALAGPQKVLAIQQLAESFQIDLKKVVQPNQTDPNNQYQTQDNQQQVVEDPRVNELANTVRQLENQQLQQRQAAADQAINSWAGLQSDGSFKNKPHFQSVRAHMFALISSGAVPPINGALDLDGAYDAACYANSTVRTVLEQEKAVKDAEKKRKDEADKVAKAKKAGLSIKPSAPSLVSNNKLNGTRSKDTSVRGSIRQAIAESAKQ